MDLDIDTLPFLIRAFGKDKLSHFNPYKDSLRVYDIPIEMLRPHEDVYSDLVELIAKEMKVSRYLKYPIIVDVRTLTILDGHHRVEALKKIGVKCAATFLVDYLQKLSTKLCGCIFT
ncbi:MAG: ParB N-terminal domain-containing protein [Ignisphaera sp.]